jgi:ectoine hydroxylase-related dioxygenase (phytanoyl-CoA dioxygenase family)
MEIPRFDDDTPMDDVFEAIDAAGGAIVEGFVPGDLLERLRKDFEPWISDHGSGTTSSSELWQVFHGTETKRITGLAAKSAAWVELLCDPRYQAFGDHYLGRENFHLNTGQLICIGPGETRQPLHRDALNWPEVAMRDGEVTVTAIFALTDFTEENGATVIAPGSHLWPGVLPHVPDEAKARVVMPAGAALLYNGKVIHGGGPNSTHDQWRVGLHAGFVLGWLRAEENHQLTTPVEVGRELPEVAKRMLGFRCYEPEFGGRLGLVDYDDPDL